jgi:hypothetical protein
LGLFLSLVWRTIEFRQTCLNLIFIFQDGVLGGFSGKILEFRPEVPFVNNAVSMLLSLYCFNYMNKVVRDEMDLWLPVLRVAMNSLYRMSLDSYRAPKVCFIHPRCHVDIWVFNDAPGPSCKSGTIGLLIQQSRSVAWITPRLVCQSRLPDLCSAYQGLRL